MYHTTKEMYKHNKESAYQMYLNDPMKTGASFDQFCKFMDRAIEQEAKDAERAAEYDRTIARFG